MERGRSTTKKQNVNSRSKSVKPKESRNRSRSRSERPRKSEKDNMTSLSTSTQYSYPSGQMSGNSFRIRKREFIKNIVPQDPFAPQKVEFNPGIHKCFPWLSGVAPNFEKYSVKRLRYIYETAQSTFVPGMVMMAPEFNISDPLPNTKTELLEYAYAARSPVWKSFSITLSEKSIMNYRDYYVRVSSVSVDQKLYDPLYLVIATDAVSTDLSYCGELWVEYDIEFTLPQIINSDSLLNNDYKRFYFGATSNSAPFTNLTGSDGNLDVVVLTKDTLQFNTDFNGMIQVVVDAANVGLQTQMVDNKSNWTLLGNGSMFVAEGVGGSGRLSDSNGISLITYSFFNLSAGSWIQINNLGYYTNGIIAQASTVRVVRCLWPGGYPQV